MPYQPHAVRWLLSPLADVEPDEAESDEADWSDWHAAASREETLCGVDFSAYADRTDQTERADGFGGVSCPECLARAAA